MLVPWRGNRRGAHGQEPVPIRESYASWREDRVLVGALDQANACAVASLLQHDVLAQAFGTEERTAAEGLRVARREEKPGLRLTHGASLAPLAPEPLPDPKPKGFAMCPFSLSLVVLFPFFVAPGGALCAPVGAPTICVPIEIGTAKSLPLEKDGGGKSSLAFESVVGETIAVLDGSDATLVHMETLRRSVLTLSEEKSWFSSSASRDQAKKLVALLHARVDAAQKAKERRPAVEGLAWFDLGYALSTLEQAGLRVEDGNVAALARAAELRPEDGAVQLGIALSSWTKEGGQDLRRKAFLRAAELASEPEGLLRRNLMTFAQRFLDVRTYDELVAKVRA